MRFSLELTRYVARICVVLFFLSLSLITVDGAKAAANGSVIYTYDALGRVLSASYDTGVIVYFAYDANGNRTSQTINVNTTPLCFGTSKWGAGLWSLKTSC